jgi:diguanylate cyclase (GGDEF)-like protein/PAS domain S-box-containing protein
VRSAIVVLSCLISQASALERSDLVLHVGVFDNPPIVFDSKQGYTGLAIDILKSIAQEQGWVLEYSPGEWRIQLERLEAGEIDILVGIAYTDARAEHYDFTEEALISNWAVVYHNAESAAKSLKDMENSRIALTTKSIHSQVFRDIMSQFGFAFTEIDVENYRQGMTAIDTGTADATVVSRVFSIINEGNFPNTVQTGIIFNPVEVRFAATQGRHRHILNTIDQTLKLEKRDDQSNYHRILAKWLNNRPGFSLPRWILNLGIFILLLIVILVVSNYLIHRRVNQRTLELRESESKFRQLAENIQEIFWIGSQDWLKIHYVSPAFKKIWGRDPHTLYVQPLSWLDAIHEEDRERVIAEVSKKAKGQLEPREFGEFRIVTPEGMTRWIHARAYPVMNESGEIVRIAGIAEDITKRKQSEETIRYIAYHDALTGLENRHSFEMKVVSAIEDAKDNSHTHAMLYIDLDQFKIINDIHGHTVGDSMLKALGASLLSAITSKTTIARLGGDEFGVLIENTTLDASTRIAGILMENIRSFRFNWGDYCFSVGASIGQVMIDQDRRSLTEIFSLADMACYAAKEEGRNRIHIYNDNDEVLLERRGEMQWVSRIERAIEEDRFILYRQSIVPLLDGKTVIHTEYLIRMLDQHDGLVMPGDFIPAAERYDLMPLIDKWVVCKVFTLIARQQHVSESGETDIHFINLSAQILSDSSFADFVLMLVDRHAIRPQSICFEITETAAVSKISIAIKFMQQLRAHGFRFALDDFGTGMSSFSYLNALPVDYLKIDGSFIRSILSDPLQGAIVEATLHISHAAQLEVIAEWIENDQVKQYLTMLGVNYGQGYAIDRPKPVERSGDSPTHYTGR